NNPVNPGAHWHGSANGHARTGRHDGSVTSANGWAHTAADGSAHLRSDSDAHVRSDCDSDAHVGSDRDADGHGHTHRGPHAPPRARPRPTHEAPPNRAACPTAAGPSCDPAPPAANTAPPTAASAPRHADPGTDPDGVVVDRSKRNAGSRCFGVAAERLSCG